ncbi:hypothetical protein P7K49_003180 [Saguinus oedipus]|uniref:Fibulin-1 n=1 Tax=Saguinus oedipus TaxID=9490 RepID=A0ABQ9WLE6_SAGOE|nr:hypothetical protein P7K49_003180 [Saguinus oedipus]
MTVSEASCVQLVLCCCPPGPQCSPQGDVAWPAAMARCRDTEAEVGFAVADIDECALPTGGHICSYRCINVPGSFQCSCPASGYKLAPNGRNCRDIDECVTGSHNCSINETCFNIQGGFRCLSFECPENYRRSADT